ncbi:hypothetical protein [Herbaspirillum sp. NPDC087042]|uniref:hypothetical protein n=1 Tax=Herbaspirillum sp. NPDC087042 TaxID=3364004 RepID=UPI0037FD810B
MEPVRSQSRVAISQPKPAAERGLEPDGTEDPWANADDGVLPGPADQPLRPHPSSPETHMHKPQDTPPVEVPPLEPTPSQDPIPHQNPSTTIGKD